jgi:hypothetical protein
MIGVSKRLGSFGNFEIRWQLGCSGQPKQPDQTLLAQRQGVTDRIVVEATGQHHAGLGVSQLRDHTRRHRGRIDHRQRG